MRCTCGPTWGTVGIVSLGEQRLRKRGGEKEDEEGV